MFLTLIEGFMEVELMVTKRDDNNRQPGEYRAICLGKVGRQSFAIICLEWSNIGFPFCQRLWTVTERPQRLVTFETFDQSDEAK